MRIGTEQGFNAPSFFKFVGRRAGVHFGHQSRVPIGDTARAKEPPSDRHRLGFVWDVFDQILNASFAAFDGQEFIRVHGQNPFAVHHLFVLGGQRQRVRLWFFAFGNVVAEMFTPAQFLKADQHIVGAVAAVVGVNANVIETDVIVERDPFYQRMAFVLHHRKNCIFMFRSHSCLSITCLCGVVTPYVYAAA